MLLYHVSRKVWCLLSPEGRRWAMGLWAFLTGAALFEILNLTAWYPFVAALTNPGVIHEQAALRFLYHSLGFTQDLHFVCFLGAGVLLVQILCTFLKATTVWAIGLFGAREKVHLSDMLLRTYLAQPHEWILSKNTGELHQLAMAESNGMVERYVVGLSEIYLGITLTAITCLGLVLIDPWVAIMSTVVIGLMFALIYRKVRFQLQELGHAIFEAGPRSHVATMEALSATKEGRLPPSRQDFVVRSRTSYERLQNLLLQAKVIGDIPGTLTETVAKAGILMVALYLTAQGNRDVMPLIALYVVSVVRVAPEAHGIYRDIAKVRQSMPVLERIYSDLSGGLEPAPDVPPERLPLASSIRLEKIEFTYKGSAYAVIRDVSLDLPQNSSLALVGETGAGKTTLADILAGLLIPCSGRVLVDGVPLDTTRRLAWRNNIGYVPQSIYLAEDSIRRNIAFGIPAGEIDDEAVRRAAVTANIHTFIEGLPAGYDTILGERGVSVSGGQRQRIGIARALYHDPSVLIFDEATSALDNVTERTILEALDQVAGKKTIIVIAHRLTTVANCDQICLLREGRIEARGTFQELEETSASFREMTRAAVREAKRETDIGGAANSAVAC